MATVVDLVGLGIEKHRRLFTVDSGRECLVRTRSGGLSGPTGVCMLTGCTRAVLLNILGLREECTVTWNFRIAP